MIESLRTVRRVLRCRPRSLPRALCAIAASLAGLVQGAAPASLPLRDDLSSLLEQVQEEQARNLILRDGELSGEEWEALLSALRHGSRGAASLAAELAHGQVESRHVQRLLEVLPDLPDAALRARLVPELGTGRMAAEWLAERVTLLSHMARHDAHVDVRRAACEALGEALLFDLEGHHVSSLIELVEGPDDSLGQLAAEVLARRSAAPHMAAGMERVLARRPPLAPARRAPLLVAEAKQWANPDVLAPSRGRVAQLAGALSSGDSTLRRAALEVQAEWLRSNRDARGAARVDELIAQLGALGIDPAWVLEQRARLFLGSGRDPLRARELATRLVQSARRGADSRAPAWARVGHYLRGMASVLEKQNEDARTDFLALRELCELGLRSHPPASSSREAAREARARFVEAAQAELGLILVLLQESTEPDDELLRDPVERLARLSLMAQRFGIASGGGNLESLDALLEAPGGALVVLQGSVQSSSGEPTWGEGEVQLLMERVGSALAARLPAELPGFASEADAGLDQSAELLAILEAAADAADYDYIQAMAAQQYRLGQEGRYDEREEERLARLEFERYDLRRRLGEVRLGQRAGLFELRFPSQLALRLARALRAEGRFGRARAMAKAFRDDLLATGFADRYIFGLELSAEAEALIAGTWSEDGEAEKAEEGLLVALGRLEEIEALLEERGASVVGPQLMQADVLVSLAVNANVKLGQPERALEYFERAFALRQDSFTRTLLACYRARSGHDAEARALLRDLGGNPGVGNFYNIACTWALLGESEEALRWLERDLLENHPSDSSLRRQRAWARADPDLRSLREDPRFRTLVGGQ